MSGTELIALVIGIAIIALPTWLKGRALRALAGLWSAAVFFVVAELTNFKQV